MRYLDFKTFVLVELTDKVKQVMRDRFKKEQPNLTDQQITYYLDRWDRFAQSFPVTNRDITRLKFSDVQKLIDDAEARAQLKGKSAAAGASNKSEDTVYDENNLLILKGDLREKCIQYGAGYSWCISRRDASNMFFTYRMRLNEPVFYFVFDKDLPKNNVWHAVVIYVDNRGIYHVATANNPGDREMTWGEIEQANPKLRGLRQLIKHFPISNDEKEDYNRYSKKINNASYAALSLKEKYKYIQFGHALSPVQQQRTPDDLIAVYAKMQPLSIIKQTYERLRPGDQRKILESILETKSAAKLTKFAIIRDAGRLPAEYEKVILQAPAAAIRYAAKFVGKWPELEKKILKTYIPDRTIEYAQKFIKGRWPEGEQHLINIARRNSYYANSLVFYTEHVAKTRVPEFENFLLQATDYKIYSAIRYAESIIKKRWPELERALIKLGSPSYLTGYARRFNIDPSEITANS